MSRNAVLGVVGLVIIVLLGVWLLSSSKSATLVNPENSTGAQTQQTTGTQKGTTAGIASQKTFRELFSQSGSYQCSYDGASATGQIHNVVNISNGKMEAEFRTSSGTQTKADLLVYSGGYLYTWKEGATAGTKTSLRSIADLPKAIPADLTSGAVFGTASENVDWDCHQWIPDKTKLSPPSYVTFSVR